MILRQHFRYECWTRTTALSQTIWLPVRPRSTPRSGFSSRSFPVALGWCPAGFCGLKDAQCVQAPVQPSQWFSSLSFFFLSVIKQFIDPKEKTRERERERGVRQCQLHGKDSWDSHLQLRETCWVDLWEVQISMKGRGLSVGLPLYPPAAA